VKNSAKHISDRIRLMITTKQFQVGELLPSTRELGRQLEASFHTVRKAYQLLEKEGLIEGQTGRGFVVKRHTTLLDKTARLEIGAEKMRVMIEELIGYGLDESEIETLFEEQLMFQEWPDRIQASVVIAETKELAQMLSEAIRRQVGVRTEAAAMHILSHESEQILDYDAIFIPIHLYGSYQLLRDQIRVIPLSYTFEMEALLTLSEGLASDTIGLVTSEDASIPILLEALKSSVQVQGSFLAGATYGKSLPLFVRNADLVVYTAGSSKMVEPRLPEQNRIALSYSLTERSVEAIRAELWDQ